MKKQLIAACMALAGFVAIAVMPAMASAAPTITYPTGTLLATGSGITGTSEGETLMTDANENVILRCTSATMTGTLTTNNSTSGFAGDIETATFKGDANEEKCTGTFGNVEVTTKVQHIQTVGAEEIVVQTGVPYCVKNTKFADQLEVRGGKCSEPSRAIRYVLHSDTIGTCIYEKTLRMLGTYVTHFTAAQATIVRQEFIRVSGFFCPSVGYLDMTFNLAKPGGDPIYIDA